jgi:hypothetical protein
MPDIFEVSSDTPNLVLEDHSYGKGGVKILYVAKNGIVDRETQSKGL